MIITTTSIAPGYEIVEHKGLVTGEVVAGVNAVKDFGAGLRNIFGGRSAGYEEEIIQARNTVLRKIEENAKNFGANAVVSLQLDVGVVDAQTGGFILVTAVGTAVTVNKKLRRE
ncbi:MULTISPECIES: YbjQ family protein [unclassified Gemella]|uniref:YbjQ family protein n=1 Tax=unclassified Gemella TaxID=2624949 RepID=UPI0010734A48|nr:MULTISPECIES: YbjQ family protein [unclassified Gemella]MBF0709982.1 YbjQ family protein [Gemella sp. GL1.1]MBF0746269.1 YbjQ family protein [Gemella sp. 19428wG2_WT2a]NYS27326.1 YbjQ family protein [Gemella sp. GL1]TFU60548.1 YbjQ family protein [Gemella sp. WT2a]